MPLNKWLLVLVSSYIVSCSNNVIQPEPKPEPVGTISLTKDWSTYVGFGSSHRDLRYRIAVQDNQLYIVGKQGRLYAIDKATGDRLWHHDFDTPITAGVTIHDNIALVGTEEGHLMAFDIEKRAILWDVPLNSEVLHSPVTDGAIVISQLNDGRISALDINNGNILWSAVTKTPNLTQRGTTTPLLVDKLVIAGFATGRLLIFDGVRGLRVWQAEIGTPQGSNQIGRLVDVDGQLYIQGSVIYSTAINGHLVALDIANRPTELWKKPLSGGSGIIGHNKQVYATSNTGVISSFDAQTGTKIWENNELLNYQYNAPVMWKNHLVVADQLGYINLINVQTGSLAGLYRNTPYAVQADFLAEEDQLYVLDIGGFLSALSLEQ